MYVSSLTVHNVCEGNCVKKKQQTLIKEKKKKTTAEISMKCSPTPPLLIYPAPPFLCTNHLKEPAHGLSTKKIK